MVTLDAKTALATSLSLVARVKGTLCARSGIFKRELTRLDLPFAFQPFLRLDVTERKYLQQSLPRFRRSELLGSRNVSASLQLPEVGSTRNLSEHWAYSRSDQHG